MAVFIGSVVLNVSDSTRAARFWSDALGYVPHPDNPEFEVKRLILLGARRVDWVYPEGADHVVLADPEGNLFDVCA